MRLKKQGLKVELSHLLVVVQLQTFQLRLGQLLHSFSTASRPSRLYLPAVFAFQLCRSSTGHAAGAVPGQELLSGKYLHLLPSLQFAGTTPHSLRLCWQIKLIYFKTNARNHILSMLHRNFYIFLTLCYSYVIIEGRHSWQEKSGKFSYSLKPNNHNNQWLIQFKV